jgi:hypothetical protein
VTRGAWAAAGLAALALLALAAPSAASAQDTLPVGEAEGVRMVRERGELVVIFTRRAERIRKRVAGRRIDVYCTQLFEDGTGSGNNPLRAPKRGRRIHTGDGSRGWDYCRLWLEARTVRRDGRRRRVDRKLMASVPLTQQGAVFLDGQRYAFLLTATLTVAEFSADDRGRDGFLTPAELLALAAKQGSGELGALVALASPSDTPPPGAIGYFSDGAKHAAAVALSTLGKRLFFEINGDVLHTNITQYVRGLD